MWGFWPHGKPGVYFALGLFATRCCCKCAILKDKQEMRGKRDRGMGSEYSSEIRMLILECQKIVDRDLCVIRPWRICRL